MVEFFYHILATTSTPSSTLTRHDHPPVSPLRHGDVRAIRKCKFLDDQENNEKLVKYGRRLGQLETEVKQLKAPDDHDATADDEEDLDDAATIEAEFREAPTSAPENPM
jgi:hypothetical protein